MIHVTMGQGDIRRTQRDARTHPDIERDVQLGDLHDRLLAGNADALDAIRRHEKKADLARTSRGLGEHDGNSISSALALPENLSFVGSCYSGLGENQPPSR